MKFPFFSKKNLEPQNGQVAESEEKQEAELTETEEFRSVLQDGDILDVLKVLERIQTEVKSITQEVFSFEPVERKAPVGTRIVILSDVHIGSIFTRYDVLRKVVEEILKNDLKVIFNGDLVDNYTRKLAMIVGIEEQIISPSTQRNIFVKMLEELAQAGKLLTFNVGNHEEFSDLDYIRLFRKRYPEIPFFLNRGELRLRTEEKTWNIVLIHKSRYNSTINPVHTGIRELQLRYPHADLIVIGHTHEDVYAEVPFQGRMVKIVKVPALKAVDPFSWRFFDPYQYPLRIPVVEVKTHDIRVSYMHFDT